MKCNSTSVKKVLRFYPCFLYFLLENWLKRMSQAGWHLIERKAIFYYFEKGEPKDKDYFVWDPTFIGMGKYSVPLRYPNLIKTYGVSKKKSKLNRNSIKNFDTIIEVDTERISDIGYQELVNDRNKLYALMSLEFFILLLLVTVLAFVLPLIFQLIF